MAERVRVRQGDDDEGRRLLRSVRKGAGSHIRVLLERLALGPDFAALLLLHRHLGDDLNRPDGARPRH
ncbi:hypothetical protein [Streptomyces sp. NBC_00083]|uniref:hypothetical protein n=1 Tax=Streptomyces sp. NBC_00083 TaxID=2975647 RepID=UPI0022542B91|nr:hypothetical protein [Streptomyces sp. NBC_00083]MCX5384694.1 hypothetical protein [Streptomyces sp. NBC_00083]